MKTKVHTWTSVTPVNLPQADVKIVQRFASKGNNIFIMFDEKIKTNTILFFSLELLLKPK